MNPRVKAVEAKEDYTLRLTFTNEEKRIFDVRPHLDFGVFSSLKDLGLFKQAKVQLGTVVWPGEIDICPDTLYEESVREKQAA